jgi:hypothetical protein
MFDILNAKVKLKREGLIAKRKSTQRACVITEQGKPAGTQDSNIND